MVTAVNESAIHVHWARYHGMTMGLPCYVWRNKGHGLFLRHIWPMGCIKGRRHVLGDWADPGVVDERALVADSGEDQSSGND